MTTFSDRCEREDEEDRLAALDCEPDESCGMNDISHNQQLAFGVIHDVTTDIEGDLHSLLGTRFGRDGELRITFNSPIAPRVQKLLNDLFPGIETTADNLHTLIIS